MSIIRARTFTVGVVAFNAHRLVLYPLQQSFCLSALMCFLIFVFLDQDNTSHLRELHDICLHMMSSAMPPASHRLALQVLRQTLRSESIPEPSVSSHHSDSSIPVGHSATLALHQPFNISVGTSRTPQSVPALSVDVAGGGAPSASTSASAAPPPPSSRTTGPAPSTAPSYLRQHQHHPRTDREQSRARGSGRAVTSEPMARSGRIEEECAFTRAELEAFAQEVVCCPLLLFLMMDGSCLLSSNYSYMLAQRALICPLNFLFCFLHWCR